MASKEEVLNFIRIVGEKKLVTREEMLKTYDEGSGAKITSPKKSKKIGVAEILYYIGGGIIFLGISILLMQNWSTLSYVTKVLVTIGAGIAAYFMALSFSRSPNTEAASPAFYMISALLMPIGLAIIIDEAGYHGGAYDMQFYISGLMFAMYLASYFLFKKNVFVLFSIIFGTWLFYSLTGLMVQGSNADIWQFTMYRTIVVGVSYIFMGYTFSKNNCRPLVGFLYSFGVFSVLFAALTLGEWSPRQNLFWELIYPGLVFGALFMSVHIKNNIFLIWGTLFLMAYIIKITSEYFSSGLGWPTTLVLAGLGLIGIGFMSMSIKNKYLSNN